MFKIIHKSFSAKIITLVLVNVVITSVIIGIVTMRSTEQFLTDRISDKFPSILLNAKGKVDLWYANKSLDLAVLSRARVLTARLEKFSNNSDPQSLKIIEKDMNDYFSYIKEKFTIYEDFALLDKKGNLMFSTSDSVSHYADFLRTLKEENADRAVISQAIRLPGSESINQWVSIPVRIKDKFDITVCARFNLHSIEHLLMDVNLCA